ncbi:MAG: hypothetical protein U0528_13755 [Anaerolineae bacterium]
MTQLNTNPNLNNRRSSAISGFYKKSLPERMALLAQWAGLESQEQAALLGVSGLSAAHADQMIENVVGIYALPFGIATNFLINNTDYLIPMVIEEPSVVAACSFAAKLARAGGGFTVGTDDPVMIGQIQVLDVDNVYAAAGRVWDIREKLLHEANDPTSSIVKRGRRRRDRTATLHRVTRRRDAGGASAVRLPRRDGANAINTACERIAPLIAEATGGQDQLTHPQQPDGSAQRRGHRA